MKIGKLTPGLVLGAALLAAGASAAQQTATGVPNALQGFSANRDKPVRINAMLLEVRDKEKRATFSGNVHLVQGDTTLRSKTLDVFYDDDGAGGGQAGQSSNQQIRMLEAKGGVLVTQKDQTATGETGIFDMRANTVTLIGSVVITQCHNVVRGDRLVVDLGTGVSRVESGKPGENRVEGLFLPNSAKGAKTATACGGSKDPAPKPAAKSTSSRPLKLN